MVPEEELFRCMAERKSIRWNPEGFELSSGGISVCKIGLGGGSDVTEALGFLKMLGEKVLEILEVAGAFSDGKQVCLIGVPTAGIPLAHAAADVRYRNTGFEDVVFRMLKVSAGKDSADPNRQLWTQNEPSSQQHYWFVENACTTANAVLRAHSKLIQHGYPPEQISALMLVDRELNGIEQLKARGISQIAVGWTITGLVAQMQELGFMSNELPTNAVEILQQEIAAFHANQPL